MSVYILRERSLPAGPRIKLLDGDFNMAGPLGVEFPAPSYAGRHPDGTFFFRGEKSAGVRIDDTLLPTRVEFGGGKKKLDDVQYYNCMIVSDAIRNVIERLEPDTHQFSSMQVQRKDGSIEGIFHWFFPLVRLDSYDRSKTTLEWRERGGWRHFDGARFVVNLGQVDGHHAWLERHYNCTYGRPYISETLKREIEAINPQGVIFNEVETTP